MSQQNELLFEKIADIKLIKRKYTKLSVDRRTEEKIRELVTETESLWENFIETVTNRNTAFYKEAEQIYLDTIQFFETQLRDFCNVSTVNSSETSSNIICCDELGKNILEYNKINNLETNNFKITMVANIKDILSAVNSTIPVFDGEVAAKCSSEVSNFIVCCKAVDSMFSSDVDKAYLLSIIKIRLRGDAFDLVSQSSFDNLEQLENILREYYIPKINYTDVKVQLVKIQQLHNETIFDYGKRVMCLLGKCKEGIHVKYTEKVVVSCLCEEEESAAVRYFQNGLINSKIKLRLLCFELNKLNLAIDKAISFESEEREIESYGNNLPKVRVINTCTCCGKLGHTVDTCWYTNNPSTSTNQFSNNRQVGEMRNGERGRRFENSYGNNPTNTSRSSMFSNANKSFACFTCGKKGHTSRSCRMNHNNSASNENVRIIHHENQFHFCQFCKVANHSTMNCSQFSNCLKNLLSQQSSGNEEGQLGDTTAAVHKFQ